MKVQSVEQFKVLEYIKANFFIEEVSLELIDKYTIRLTDKTGESMNFKYENGNITHS